MVSAQPCAVNAATLAAAGAQIEYIRRATYAPDQVDSYVACGNFAVAAVAGGAPAQAPVQVPRAQPDTRRSGECGTRAGTARSLIRNETPASGGGRAMTGRSR
jgi:hypothetical protein